eukprot:jgi/Botrbrau1/8663/Bobra.0087s0017.2
MLGFNFDLKDQLAFYGAYHSKPWNQFVHFLFVPLILWSAGVWFAYIPTSPVLDLSKYLPDLPPLLARTVILNGAFWLLLGFASYYVILEPFAGITWGIFQALPTWILATMFVQNVPFAWAWAFGLHFLSWVVQVHLGHITIEKRRPALLDSFFQSLVLAPLFAWFEGLFRLGYRPALRRELDSRIQADLAGWKAQKEALLKEGTGK